MKARRPADWRPELFWRHVDQTGDCWPWLGWMHKRSGYGVIRRKGENYAAHRAAYEIAVGPIPDDLEIDHLCRNRGCVNPSHLEPVTHLVNQHRGHGIAGRVRMVACHRGHPFTPANTLVGGRGTRSCRTCTRERVPSRLVRNATAKMSWERRQLISEVKRARAAERRAA